MTLPDNSINWFFFDKSKKNQLTSYLLKTFKILHPKKKPTLFALANTQVLDPPAKKSEKLDTIDVDLNSKNLSIIDLDFDSDLNSKDQMKIKDSDLKNSITEVLNCLKESDGQENVYKTICSVIVETLLMYDFKIYNLYKKNGNYFEKKRLTRLIMRVFLQYLRKTLPKQHVNALINSSNYQKYLYKNYLEFCNSFDIQTVLLLARKKEYTDHKSFYRDFLPHFETVYHYKSPLVRRNNGLYLLNIEKLSQNESKQLTERKLESIVNKKSPKIRFKRFLK